MKPSFKSALWFWLKLGFISFGGPAGQIGIMHEFLVEKKKWISESRFLHALNYTMILPGPEAQQLATYTGWLLHGTFGGLAAGALFVLPSMFILLALASIYVTYGNVPFVYAIFDGLKPAVIAIVILALLKISKKSLRSFYHFIIATMSFISIFFLNVPFPIIIVSALLLAFTTRKFFPGIFKEVITNDNVVKNERDYFINQNSTLNKSGFRIKKFTIQVITFVLFWATPFILFYLLSSEYLFWKQLSIFFTQAAFVTFGGAYAVLPYVAQVSVEKLHWLTELQMIDGLALGETTPGPLVMVLVFVGFLGSYNHFGESLGMGAIGLLVTTYYTFLPCFLFIFSGAPFIEQTRGNPRIKEILSLVTAAVVGVVMNLTIYLGKAVIFSGEASISEFDFLKTGWIILSLIVLQKSKIGMISWIGLSALFGLGTFLLSG